MLKDYEMIIHKIPDVPFIKLYAIGDLHLGAQECMESEWLSFCKKVAEEKDSYLILTGDLMNNGTRSSVSNIFKEKMTPSEEKKDAGEDSGTY